MFEQNGENIEGPQEQCPGDGQCAIWDSTAGRPREERELSCLDCKSCSGPPAAEEDGPAAKVDDDPAIVGLVDEIEDIVLYQDAGSATDWRGYPAEYLWLAGQWRKAEKTVAALVQQKLLRALTYAGTKGNS